MFSLFVGRPFCSRLQKSNPCPLFTENESCTRGVNITRVFEGACDPCASVTCDSDYTCRVDSPSRDPSCLCKSTCLDVVEPVCASNGKTYRNQCTMDQVMSIILIDHFICVRVVAKLLDTSTTTCQCLNFSPALLSCSKNWIDLYVTKVWKYIR